MIIVGAGIVGAATAYFLAKDHGIQSIILEGWRPAGAASGKAGGFLARDWTRGSPKDTLVQLSWELYPDLVGALSEAGEGSVQFRTVDTLEVVADERRAPRDAKRAKAAKAKTVREYGWIDGHQFGSKQMGSSQEGNTAQVHPGLLTLALLRQAKVLAGSTVRHGWVEGLLFVSDPPSPLTAVTGSSIPDADRRSAPPPAPLTRHVTHVIASGTFREATLDPSEFLVAEKGGATQPSDVEANARAWHPHSALTTGTRWDASAGVSCADNQETRDRMPATAASSQAPAPASAAAAASSGAVTCQAFPTSAVIVCTGPWTGHACSWFDPANTLLGSGLSAGTPCLRPTLPVGGSKAHSIVLLPEPTSLERHDTPVEAAPAALFLDFVDSEATAAASPEVYPRPDGSVYICGCADDDTLPASPDAVKLSPGAAEMLLHVAGAMSSSLGTAALVRRQACYLPMSDDDQPCVGEVPGVSNALVGAGHGCWGILMAPSTGKWLARQCARGDATKTIGPLKGLDPGRFAPSIVPVAFREPEHEADKRTAPDATTGRLGKPALPVGGGAHAGAVPMATE